MASGPHSSGVHGVLRRALVEPFDRQLIRELGREIGDDCRSLLDLGCGRSSPVGQISSRIERCVGVDAFEPYLQQSVAAGIHTDYRCTDVMRIDEHFPPGSFDCVVALDLIEHLPKASGMELLHRMETIAARKVIVFTPNGFVPQAPYDDNPFQEHLSGWEVDELSARGYRILGLHGWRPLRGELGVARWKPRRLWELVALWTQPLVRQHPTSAFHLLCIKDIQAQ